MIFLFLNHYNLIFLSFYEKNIKYIKVFKIDYSNNFLLLFTFQIVWFYFKKRKVKFFLFLKKVSNTIISGGIFNSLFFYYKMTSNPH